MVLEALLQGDAECSELIRGSMATPDMKSTLTER